MTFRLATGADVPALSALLRAHIQTSMFPLANLIEHGIGGSAPRAMRFWLRADGSGAYGETNEGMALPQLPRATVAEWRELAALGCGVRLIGALGDAGQVRAMLAAWAQGHRPARHDSDEPGFSLDLVRLHVPPAPEKSRIVPLEAVPEKVVVAWRRAYHIETLGTPPATALAAATSDVASWRRAGSHRVLLVDETPAALTGFNAEVGDVVQIGGVFTPPEARGQGLARRAVALHLAEARSRGIRRAVLFAAHPSAARAYTAIGFQPAGEFAMVLFETPGAQE